ncbi:MAG: NADH ubiquinone oxidoreductase [Rhodobacteraceae bacterium]|nr:NADH ubiquinone oxidoreductase [Paracoccaceae bacterium]
MLEDFETAPEARWDYVADTVMGGVSTGQVQFLRDGNDAFARLTGTVSTENNGGFIQFRHLLDNPLTDDTQGLRLIVRGNGQPYFLHLRTRGTRLPWQYYQARFDTNASWSEIRVPLSAFKPSGALLRKEPRAKDVTSVGIVAFGRDHQAQVEVLEIGTY